MTIHKNLVVVVDFIFTFVGNWFQKTWLWLFENSKIEMSGFSQRLVAGTLLLAMVLPMIFIGQIRPVMAQSSSTRPLVETPSVFFAPPEPFQMPNSNYAVIGKNNSLALALGIWDSLLSLFSSSETTSLPPECPSGYAWLGIGMLSDPSAAVLGNRLMVFIRGNDNAIYWKYTEDGVNFSDYIMLGGGTFANPRTLVSNGTLYLEVTGTDNNPYYQATSNGGNSWSGWIQGSVNAQTTSNVSFLGNNYNFVRGSGDINPLCVQISNSNTSGNTASFVATDSNTQGNWLGNYGSQGHYLVNDSSNLPGFLQFSASGNNSYTWAASTSDQRALKKAANNNDRIAATWWSATQFDLNFNFTDGQNHYLTLHTMDWDNVNRAATFEVYDATTNAILDTRNVTNFVGGKYLRWQVKGNTKTEIETLLEWGDESN